MNPGSGEAPGAPAGAELPSLPARFRIEKLLGHGSQRKVYLARDIDQDRWVAISVFDTSSLAREDLDRITQVHEVAGSGAHPHVLPIEQLTEADGSLFMVSPFLSGGDLATRLDASDKLLPLAETLRIASQVCRGLGSLHAAGIAHRDVKPGNVLLDERGDAHLGDLGLAVKTDPRTHPGAAGTPAYVAPEQIANPPGGAGADLYSLGCLLYELTTGRPPFVGESASDVLLQHQTARPVPPVKWNPALPLVLSELILKLLEKHPGARPASAGDVRAALDGILRSPGVSFGAEASLQLPDGQRPSAPLPLVGRQPELHALDAALARVCESVPGLVLVSGEAGGGKSRLLSELRARAESRGCIVLMGTGDELRTASYQPFGDALLPLAGRFSDLAAVHGDLLRDFLYRGQDADKLDRLTPQGVERERLFASAFAALATFSKEQPIVFLLEDLHAFDSASLELFEHLASAMASASGRRDLALLVVASTRPPAGERLGSLLASLRSETGCQWLDLAPLDEAAIFDLLRALGADRRPSGQLCHKVLKATDGNPLFVSEVIRRLRDAALLDHGTSSPTGGPWDVELELPSSVDHAIAERIGRLDEDCRGLLTIGALLGARFQRTRLAQVSERPESECARGLALAFAEGLLVEDGVILAFAHPLILQAVRDQVSPSERRRLHFQIASRLLAFLGQEPDLSAVEVAHHLVRSEELADPTELTQIAGLAGQQALARFAWNDAAELLESAIAAANRGAGLDDRAVAELHRNAGLAYFRLIDEQACLRHYDAAVGVFERIHDDLGLARTLNDRVRIASLLGLSYGDLGKRDPLEAALGRLGPADATLRMQILNTLAESYWCAGQIERSEQLGEETLALASSASEHRLCADASIALGMARFIGLRVEEAGSTWQAGAAHARRAGDLIEEQRCLVRSSLALTATARFEEAMEAVRVVQELHRVLHLQNEMSLASGVLLAVATIRGDFAAAELHGADALERVRRVGYGWGTVLCVPALACARALQSDAAGAIRALDRLFEPGMGFEDPSSFQATARCLAWLAHWYAGDRAAIDAGEVKGLLPEVQGHPHLNALLVACSLIELADALQAPELAEAASGMLAVAQRQGFVFACSWPFFVPRLRGVAAVLAGRHDLGEEQLGAAIALAERVGARIELARSQLDLARLLATRNAGEDRARALSLVAACRPAFARTGPTAFGERAERLHSFLSVGL